RHVIGVGRSEAALAADWPRVAAREALDVAAVLRADHWTTDLYYYDGPLDVPAWLQPDGFARYLELAGSVRAEGPGVTLARHEDAERPLVRRLDARRPRGTVKGAPRRPEGPARGVSCVGTGEWPLGMILRQVVKNEGIALRGACDRRPEMLHLAGQALPFDYLTTDYDELLADERTDMVVIATYHGSHADLAIRALAAGKNVFLEKPPVIDEDQLGRLLAAEAESEGFLYVGYNRRFAPATDVLARQLAEVSGPTTLNMVAHTYVVSPNSWYFWPSNGNRIISNVCHFIDYALQLTHGAAPVRVTASPAEIGRPDQNVSLSIQFDDGSLASITYTERGCDPGTTYFQRYQVLKGDLTATIEDFKRLRVYRDGRKADGWRGPLDIGHGRQMARVADALKRGEGSPVPIATTEQSARLVLAAARSAEQGAPVELEAAPARQ
nr:Gfo/Idh/MocA family oxidoreductase [Actinomycetota bacterium]